MESVQDSTSSDSSESSSGSEETDTSLDEQLEERHWIKSNHLKNYVESFVATYNDLEFQQHFRLSRKTSNFLIGLLFTANVLPTHSYGPPKVDCKKGLLCTLWYLSNIETFRQVSDRFGIAKDTVRKVIIKILQYFRDHSREYIVWPSNRTAVEIENQFFKRCGFHGILGAIDGSHIKIARPKHDQESFCNRKGYHSMVLQGICDHKKQFIEVFFGEPGSQHDARVLRKSNIYKRAEQGTLHMGNNFLLGDSAYPLLNWLIPPFRDDGTLTTRQKKFNSNHSTARVVIEHTFGLLKGRFRRLLYVFDNHDLEFIVLCVTGSCVLHNICLSKDDVISTPGEISQEDNEIIQYVQDENSGSNKRNSILNKVSV